MAYTNTTTTVINEPVEAQWTLTGVLLVTSLKSGVTYAVTAEGLVNNQSREMLEGWKEDPYVGEFASYAAGAARVKAFIREKASKIFPQINI